MSLVHSVEEMEYDDSMDRCPVCGRWMKWEVEMIGVTKRRILYWCNNCGYTDSIDEEM